MKRKFLIILSAILLILALLSFFAYRKMNSSELCYAFGEIAFSDLSAADKIFSVCSAILDLGYVDLDEAADRVYKASLVPSGGMPKFFDVLESHFKENKIDSSEYLLLCIALAKQNSIESLPEKNLKDSLSLKSPDAPLIEVVLYNYKSKNLLRLFFEVDGLKYLASREEKSELNFPEHSSLAGGDLLLNFKEAFKQSESYWGCLNSFYRCNNAEVCGIFLNIPEFCKKLKIKYNPSAKDSILLEWRENPTWYEKPAKFHRSRDVVLSVDLREATEFWSKFIELPRQI